MMYFPVLRVRLTLVVLLSSIGFFPFGAANAAILDLTSAGASGSLSGDSTNGLAIFGTPPNTVSGTGLIDSFLRIQANGTEKGYNTDGTLEFATKPDGFTDSITVNDLQKNKVTVGITDYYEFVLDTNENDSFLTLNDLEFYIADQENLTGYPSLGTKVYDLDGFATGDNTIETAMVGGSGSGRLDMLALLPTSIFGTDLTKYIYLYSEFGVGQSSSGGFEEWSLKKAGTFTDPDPTPTPSPVPEPASLAIWSLLGLTGLGFVRWSQRRRAA